MRAGILRLLPIMAVFAVVAFPAGASADPNAGTIVVDTPADPAALTDSGCSLRQAIASANDNTAYGGCIAGRVGGTDTIEVPTGDYELTTHQLLISSDIDIVGGGARSTVIHGSGSERVLEISSGTVTITDFTIQGGNTSAGNDLNHGIGGGIFVDSGGSLTLQDSEVIGDTASAGGGGITNWGRLVVVRSTIENNSTTLAGGKGGGIDDAGFGLAITNSTVFGNVSDEGGGLYLGGTSATALLNDTVARNISNATAGGGITVDVNGSPSNVVVTNTILAENQLSAGSVISECSTGIQSGGHNLADDGSCNLGGPGDKQNTLAQLAPSVYTDGPTNVLTPDPGSPAIDNGDDMACPTTDQLYVQRPQAANPCDIGAYEFTTGPSNYIATTPGEIDSALSSASSFGVDATIDIAPGHYDLGNTTGTVGVASSGGNVTVEGSSWSSTFLDGDNKAPDVVDVGGSDVTTIQFLTVEGGQSDGIYDNGRLNLNGAVVVQDNGHLGIEATNQDLEITSSTIVDNGAINGIPTDKLVILRGTFEIETLHADGNFGSAVYEDSGSTLQLKDATIAKNFGLGLELQAPRAAVNTIIANNDGGDCDPSFAGNTKPRRGDNLDTDRAATSPNRAICTLIAAGPW